MFRGNGIRVVAPVAVGVAGLLVCAVAPAQAAPRHQGGVHFGWITYNGAGNDTGSNASRNSEYVQIHNAGRSAVQLQGYKVRDKNGWTYTFRALKVGAGKTVTLRTGSGRNTAANVYWDHRYRGRAAYVWNNSGQETATLYNARGRSIDSCSWKGKGSPSKAESVNCH
ncbi:lamin tail domain-containing protein [Streptomyces sp. NBC_00237]|uniref:lamin tail domain-containing protein n=1 Tax=Streptomyces sp. NBC_00237 TaxID=2975687 RepID=UPI00224E7E2E|nr:lamin tail domain-containing protein [Streptomyces sp. NBC_00237]MCX5203474.1 lamin tail domain-containing protein [Streptomyces sp. NBC_00237]